MVDALLMRNSSYRASGDEDDDELDMLVKAKVAELAGRSAAARRCRNGAAASCAASSARAAVDRGILVSQGL